MSFSYDATDVDMTIQAKPAPAGEYNLIVRETTPKLTKKKEDGTGGYPMVSAKCEIDDEGPYLGKTVWHNVTFLPKQNKGAGISLHFLKAIGEPYEGRFEIDEQQWVGRRFKAKLIVENDLKGIPRNKVAYVITPQDESDEVPF